MPKFNDADMMNQKLPTGTYGYSATKLDSLGATEYTLVTIVQDVSSSVSNFKKEMEDMLQTVVKACKYSPRSDNLMLRLVQFNSNVQEVHGFKLLQNCNLDDYNDCLTVGGMTALFDASENAIMATADYGKKLTSNDFNVNAIIFIVTDGEDVSSTLSPNDVKKAVDLCMQNEYLESVLTILIGVNTARVGVSDYLDTFKNIGKLSQFIDIKDATPTKLAKLAQFVSKSISSQSQSLGTGSNSVPLSLDL
ncbi:MAG: vWA domain-containing protein [Phenylobacterium sp.]